MLLAVTPNPALDRTLVIGGMRPGGVYRAERVLMAAGGKGLNVARAALALGQPLRVYGLLGGLMGQMVARLAAEEGFDCCWSWHSAGETRTCTLVVDPQAEDATALNEAGPLLQASDWQNLAESILAAAADAALITISGSLPAGIAPEALAALLQTLAAAGHRAMVDSSGPALQAALTAPLYGVKVNSAELGAALGRTISDVAQAARALDDMRQRGVALAVVTLGAQGALAASAEGICWARPPVLKIISSVGCGDSLLAGLTTGLLRGYPLSTALRLGVACGASDALTVGGGLLDLGMVEQLRQATAVVWL